MPAAQSVNTSELLDALTDRLRGTFEPRHPSTGPAETRVSENGSTSALRVEVEGIKGQFHDFREETNTRFGNLDTGIRSLTKTVNDFIATQGSRGGESLYKLAGVVATAMALGFTVIGAFGTLAKANLDTNIAFTNEKISSGDKVLTDQMMRLVGVVDRLSDTTMPRSEIKALVDQGVVERRDLREVKADKTSLAEMDRRISERFAAVDSNVARLQHEADDIRDKQVSRSELEQHWKESQDRLNINADRILGLQREVNGAGLADQIKNLQAQIQAIQAQERAPR